MVSANKKLGLHVMILGGTIDFELNPDHLFKSMNVDQLTPRKKSIIPFFFNKRVKYPKDRINFSRVSLKDSRNLTKEDYKRLYDEIRDSPYDNILVTMGIVNMENVAKYLSRQKNTGKVIGLVGSHSPLTAYKSDAGFHLGFATAQMQIKKPGIHIFHPDKNRKAVLKILKNTVFLITGGTIDSGFSEHADTAIPYSHSHIPVYFKKYLGIELKEPELIFHEVCMKDSRELSENQIREVITKSKNLSHKNQIITGGTYALTDLGNRYAHMIRKKEISNGKYLFVGAMIPEDVFYSDGWFNIGYALGKIEDIKPGATICMHAWATKPDNVMKQLHESKFLLYDKDIKF